MEVVVFGRGPAGSNQGFEFYVDGVYANEQTLADFSYPSNIQVDAAGSVFVPPNSQYRINCYGPAVILRWTEVLF